MPNWNRPPRHASGLYVDRPVSGPDGFRYRPTDSPVEGLYVGGQWLEYACGQRVYSGPFPGTWANQGTATIDITHGGVQLRAPMTDGGDTLRIREMALPVGAWAVTIGFVPMFTIMTDNVNGYSYWAGLALRESATGKLQTFVVANHYNTSRRQVEVDNWNSVTSYNGNHTKWDDRPMGQIEWLKMTDDGVTRNFYHGRERTSLQLIDSCTHATGFTTAPDRVGFVLDGTTTGAPNPSADSIMHVVSWEGP